MQNRAWFCSPVTFLRWLGLGIFLFSYLNACKKSSPPAVIPVTPLQTLVNTDTTLSFYHRLILQANEAGLLADDSVTLLIPTNAAFRAAGYTADNIDSLGASVADRLLLYHCITAGGIVPDSSGYKAYPTLAGFSVYGRKDSTARWLFNTVPTTGSGSPVGKALVYRMTNLLNAPADSLEPLLGGDSTLSFCAELFLRTGMDSILTLGGNYTVLAPTNNAFIAAGFDSVQAIDSADLTTMTALAKNHVLTDFYFTDILRGLSTVTTLQGNSLTVHVSNGVLQFTGSDPTPANLTDGNRTAGNTIVVHRIDKVLSP